MSVEGYAYISPGLPFQGEQAGVRGEMMRGRRNTFDQDYKDRRNQTDKIHE